MNNNLEFENEDPSPDSIEDNHPRTNYGAGYEGLSINKDKASYVIRSKNCKHNWEATSNIGFFQNTYNCTKCGSTKIE
jgi:hypothetical protein